MTDPLVGLREALRIGAEAYAELLREVQNTIPHDVGTDRQAYDHIIKRLQDKHGSYQAQIAKAVSRGISELQRAQVNAAGFPCGRCGQECHEEFTVPNDVWNAVIRRGKGEGSDEYICESCYLEAVTAFVRAIAPNADAVPHPGRAGEVPMTTRHAGRSGELGAESAPLNAGAEPATEAAYLCFAWGETDLPVAVIAVSRAEVLQFLVNGWFGEWPEQMHEDNRQEWDAAVSEFDAHDWREVGPLKWTFEIGGVEITKVSAHSSPAAEHCQPAATVRVPRDLLTAAGLAILKLHGPCPNAEKIWALLNAAPQITDAREAESAKTVKAGGDIGPSQAKHAAPSSSVPLTGTWPEREIRAYRRAWRKITGNNPPHEGNTTHEHALAAVRDLALAGRRARDEALASLRRKLQLDENGDNVCGAEPLPGWETGYCAGLRTAYRALKGKP